MDIEIDTSWDNKETKERVFIVWGSDEVVTYMTDNDRTPIHVPMDEFISGFERAGFTCMDCGYHHEPHECRTSFCVECDVLLS